MPTMNSLPLVATGSDRTQTPAKSPAEGLGSHPFGELLGREAAPVPVDSVSTGGCGESGQSGKELQLDGKELPPSPDSPVPEPDTLIAGMTLPVAVAQPQETPAGEYGPAITPAQSGDALSLEPALAPAAGQAISLPPGSDAPPRERTVPVAGAVIATGEAQAGIPDIDLPAPDGAGIGRSDAAAVLDLVLPRQPVSHPRAPGDAVRVTDEAVTGLGAANTPGDKTTLLATATAAVSGDADAMTQHGGRPDAPFKALDSVKSPESLLPTPTPTQPPTDQAGTLSGSVPPRTELQLPAGLKLAAPATMSAPPGHPGWSGEMAGRINLMISGGTSEASLQLTPPELGRLDIRISTDEDGAKILFTVQNAHAREAIENSLPRLREMLGQSGLQLAQSTVADQSGSQQRHGDLARWRADFGDAAPEPGPAGSVREALVLRSNSTVDYYV